MQLKQYGEKFMQKKRIKRPKLNFDNNRRLKVSLLNK